MKNEDIKLINKTFKDIVNRFRWIEKDLILKSFVVRVKILNKNFDEVSKEVDDIHKRLKKLEKKK